MDDSPFRLQSDSALTILLQQGDLEALGILYDRHRHLVYRTALAITGDHEAASDLLQDVFLRLFRFADHIDPNRPIEPWLYRMTANLAYTWVKHNRRWLRVLDNIADWLSGPENDIPHKIAEQNDEWNQVQKALSALPVQQRVVIVLFYLNDLSLQDISEILDIPIGTVKSRLHYGRRGLQKHLGLKHSDELPDLTYESP